MSTQEEIEIILKDRYDNYKPLHLRALQGLHETIRRAIGDEKFLLFLKQSALKNPRPVFSLTDAISDVDLSNVSTKSLENELKERQDKMLKRCPTCGGKWTIYDGCSRSWKNEPHCFGCRKPVELCTC